MSVTNVNNARFIWPLLIRPIMDRIFKRNPQAARVLTVALGNAENNNPGLLLELVKELIHDDPLAFFMSSLNECLLRAQRIQTDSTNGEQSCKPPNDPLLRQTFDMKKLFARIPDDVNNRSTFLQTIKEIASAIKKTLDCIDRIRNKYPSLEQYKRQLVKDSKHFSQTLKDYFKGEVVAEHLFISAVQLIYDVNLVEKFYIKLVKLS